MPFHSQTGQQVRWIRFVIDVATALAAIGGGRVLMTLGAYRSVSSSWVGIRQSA